MTSAVATKKANKSPRKWHKQARGRVPHPTEFGKILYASITNRGWSANQFAREVSMSSGFISGVYSGLKKPPVSELEKWAKKLRLTKEQSSFFIIMGQLEHVKTAAPMIYKAITSKEFEKLRLSHG